MYNLILASKSPRRQMLLRESGFDYTLRLMDVEESFPADMPAVEVAEFLARKKAAAMLADLKADELLITSDTTVVLDNAIYNKPEDREDAIRILRQLSGRVHTVVTGVCLSSTTRQHSFSEKAFVHFKPISDADIEFYIDKYQPYDKAGAYAIQEWIGLTHIAKIEGSYSNIMGLPTERLYEEIKNWTN